MPTSEQRTPTGFTEPVNAQVGTEQRTPTGFTEPVNAQVGTEQRTPTGFTEPVNAQVGTERREFQAFAPAPLPPKGIDISPSAFSEFDDNSFALADLARPRTRRDQPRESVGDHQWWCGGCGAFNERDHNAAMNLSNWQGLSFPVSGRGDCVSPAMPAVVVEASTATPVQSPIERLEQISVGFE